MGRLKAGIGLLALVGLGIAQKPETTFRDNLQIVNPDTFQCLTKFMVQGSIPKDFLNTRNSSLKIWVLQEEIEDEHKG